MCTLLNKASRHENVWTDEAVSSHVINLDVDKLLASRPICLSWEGDHQYSLNMKLLDFQVLFG